MALRLVTARYNWVSKAYYGASNQAKHAISIEIPEIYLSKSILETNVNSIDSNINRLLNILEVFPLNLEKIIRSLPRIFFKIQNGWL